MFNQSIKQENKENLSYNMYAGSQRAQLTRQNTIFVVGQSRVGKSTLFNHLVGIRLKGVQVKKHNVIYEADMHDQAQVKYSFKSVTILPNIKDIQINGTTLAVEDMAGFNDRNRSFAGVFMVSYMLVESFKVAKNAKFILVLEEANITLSKFEDILKPFANFINMFRQEKLFQNEQIIKNLMSSIVLVITRATKKYEDTESRLNQIKEELQDEQQKTTEQRLIFRLLQDIIEKKRFYLFDKAKKDQYAPACTLFSDMENKDWKYFQFQKNQDMIEIPFARDYEQLSRLDKEKYIDFQQNKIKLYRSYSMIVKKLLDKSLQKSAQAKISYGPEFKEIDQFIHDNDRYEDEKMIQRLGIQMTKPQTALQESVSGFTLLNKLSEANKIFQQMSSLEAERSCVALRQFQVFLKQIMTIFMDIYCHSRKEQVIFMKGIFIYIQSIQEFASIDEVEEQKGAVAVEAIKDSFLQIMPEMIIIIVQYLRNCEPNEKNLNEIEAKLDELIENNSEEFPDELEELKRKQISVKILRGDFDYKKDHFSTSLSSYLKALDCLENQKNNYDNIPEEMSQFFQNRLIQIYSKIGKCLREMKLFSLSFEAYKVIAFVDEMDKCYRLIEGAEKSLDEKYKIMLQHGEFGLKYGRVAESIKVYQRMKEIFYYNSQYKKAINKCINDCLLNFTQMRFTEYRDILESQDSIVNDQNLIMKIKEEQQKYQMNLDKSIHTNPESDEHCQENMEACE